MMRLLALMSIALTVACTPAAPKNTYDLHGQILSIDMPRKTLTIRHGEIKGLMPAMTMPYNVRDGALLSNLAPGDLIDARLVVESNDAFLSRIQKTGHASLDGASSESDRVTAPAAPAANLLQPGDAVPDAPFVTQDGKPLRFGGFRGSLVVMTFIYTRCPLPTFCPLMDRHFAEIQRALKSDSSLSHVHLVTVTFDPDVDTPPVLKRHARSLDADLRRWTFLTGRRDVIERFASRFGVFVSRAPNDPRDITHNLRTAIIDADGKVVKLYTGNDWTPPQILADLRDVIRESGFGLRKTS